MCLSPIDIINPQKYVSLKYRNQYLLQVPCGKCAECQTNISNAWMYRSYYEFRDCLSSGGFVYFDTLTYDDKHLPYMDDVLSDLPHYPCFSSRHITNYLKLLRTNIIRSGFYDVTIRYFLASEYGTDSRFTHRPHYHVLFFVTGDINPLVFSNFVSSYWSYGRTDGFPYKSSSYVLGKNVIRSNNLGEIIRTCNYVTKYVQKSCKFQKEIDFRLKKAFDVIATKSMPDDPETYKTSVVGRRMYSKLKRLVNQFHRQSLHYGESALHDIDLDDLEKTGVLIMPHYHHTKLAIPLPMYYKRKLYYDLVEVDGSKHWQLSADGVRYRASRKLSLLHDLENKFKCVCAHQHLDYDCRKLADYVYNQRGRINGLLPESLLTDTLQSINYYNYATQTDRLHLGRLGVSPQWIGNVQTGYCRSTLPAHLSFSQFIGKYVIKDELLEHQLSVIYSYLYDVRVGMQKNYELKQRLTNLYKTLKV